MINKISAYLMVTFIVCLNVNAQTAMQVKQMAYADSTRLTAIYKDLHQNPELGFMEVRTAAIIAKELKGLGYQVITGIAKTGVVGIFKNGIGPVVMYRADMDGLPVKERTGLPYACTKTGKNEDGTETPVMHACGHDAHITWLMGIAKIMMAMKNDWQGTLVLVAQPAEEKVQGARAMVADKMYDKGVPVPDFLFGMHTKAIAVGKVENGYGARFAGTDQLDVTFTGIGGHGSAPEMTKDPVVMGAAAIMLYQTIISRNIAAQDAAVLTVGAFHAGVANNVIPASADLKLNIRWFNEKSRNTLLDGIKRINESIALANDLPRDKYPSITMKGNAYPLVNDEAMVNRVNKSLETFIKKDDIITNTPSIMGSEDFHHLVFDNKKTVYDYLMIGTANPALVAQAKLAGKTAPFSAHNDNYQVDLAAIPLGTQIGVTALLELFKK
jgi:hippurate hydrolase